MTEDDAIGAALARLDAALTRLETAVSRRDAAPDDRDAALAILGEDRARLVIALDAAHARLAEVEAATGAVEHRLERAIAAVEGVLADADRP